MRPRIVLCIVLGTLVAVVPTAAAQPQRVQHAQIAQSVGDSVASELVRAGVNAAVAKWAPGLEQYVNPLSAGLGAVQAQLAEITNKLNQLIDHQYAVEARLNCAIQRTNLNSILGDAKGWFKTLTEQQYVSSLSARKENLALLFGERERMLADQEHLHIALIGADGAIRACAQHIQIGLRPFFSANIGDEVNDFYAIYHTAAAEILVVRANLMALYPGHFAPDAAQKAARELEIRWADERSWIKPTFPDWLAYDTQTGVLWQFHMVSWQYKATGYIQQLQDEGWWVTGYNDIPTCSAVEAEFRKSGFTGYDAISWMYRHKVMWVNGPPQIRCYDDHGRLHEFNLATYHYVYAGDFESKAAAVVARPNVRDGKTYINVAHYAYAPLTP